MSKQQEEFKRRAAEVLKRAERESGPYRELLLGLGEAFAALAFHQAVLDNLPQTHPAPPVRRQNHSVATSAALVDVPSPHSPSKTGVNALMAGEGYSEIQRRRMGEG